MMDKNRGGHMRTEQKGFGLFGTIIIIIVTAFISAMTTGVILFNSYRMPGVTYTDLSHDAALRDFLEAYASIVTDYYEDVDKEAMVSNAINAMFNYLGDAYSQYLTKEQTEALAQRLQGEYEGVGIQITTGNVIDSVFEDSPAEKGGLQKGDVIVGVNGESMLEKTTSDVANAIKESKDSIVKLTVKREKEEITVSLERKKMYIPSISSEVKQENGHKIGYLKIDTFSNTLYEQVSAKVKRMEEDGIESLIVDVRNNSGGYLTSANKVASMFLEKGKTIYSLQDKDSTVTYRDETDAKKEYPVVVLINEYSASASEILAAALKESYGATLVGEKSYGKGKVQQTMKFDNGSMVKYTSSKWLTPNGTCIDKVGITPDVVVENEVDEEGTVLKDLQLEKAVEILAK